MTFIRTGLCDWCVRNWLEKNVQLYTVYIWIEAWLNATFNKIRFHSLQRTRIRYENEKIVIFEFLIGINSWKCSNEPTNLHGIGQCVLDVYERNISPEYGQTQLTKWNLIASIAIVNIFHESMIFDILINDNGFFLNFIEYFFCFLRGATSSVFVHNEHCTLYMHLLCAH